MSKTVGSYLAARLCEAGLRDLFSVPGDFNLVLLDELLKQPGLRMIGCCNELNAGYAADGYVREAGFGAVVVTYMVGGLSVINAAAGAYSDDLPLLVISGGPNSNDESAGHRLHHTIGEAELYQAACCFEPVVAKTFIVRRAADAPAMIDGALLTCLSQKKPVYLEIACNIASQPVPERAPLTLPPPQAPPDSAALDAAVAAVAERIASSVKPVLVAGVKIRPAEALGVFRALAEALGCAVAVMPNAKGLFPESHPAFIGTYWGSVSSPDCAEIVESSDCQIFAGPMFNDYTTVGWTALLSPSKLVEVGMSSVAFEGHHFSNVPLARFLEALAARVEMKPTSLEAFRRLQDDTPPATRSLPADTPLSLRELRQQVQDLLEEKTSLVVETGDAWFNGQKLRLPDGAHYHFQMQYGSIGWAVGATLGVALASGNNRRTVALIGDGSFQLTAQEVSTMVRYRVPAIIFLLNNGGYTIEVEIHDGPYNNIQNWDYAGLVKVFKAGEGDGLGLRATTSAELARAIEEARNFSGGPVLIECLLDRDDCTRELLEWGSRVAAANGRI